MFKRALMMLCCAFLFAAISARASDWDKRTVMTFSQPVELPGIVLPAGTYVFRLLDSKWNRHIVQVFNEDESKIYATILAIPNYRLTQTEETVVRFTERAPDAPGAVKAWFYPGDMFGQEFVYPKARALDLAAETKAPVLAAAVTPEQKPEELMKAPVETVAPPTLAAEETWKAAEPEPVVTPEPMPAPEPAPTPELPETASSLPLIALVGASSIVLAAMLRLVSRRRS